jgi:hypothetical protein
MSLSDLASLGSFISGVAVLISLIYLALQVRQAEKNQRSLMQQGQANRICDLLLRNSDPSLAMIYRKGLAAEPLSEVELTQFNNLFRAQLMSRHDTFLQHEQHLTPEPSFRTLRLATRDLMRAPGARAMWRNLRHIYEPSFQAFIDESVQGAPGPRAGEDLELWNAAVAQVGRAAEGDAGRRR